MFWISNMLGNNTTYWHLFWRPNNRLSFLLKMKNLHLCIHLQHFHCYFSYVRFHPCVWVKDVHLISTNALQHSGIVFSLTHKPSCVYKMLRIFTGDLDNAGSLLQSISVCKSLFRVSRILQPFSFPLLKS